MQGNVQKHKVRYTYRCGITQNSFTPQESSRPFFSPPLSLSSSVASLAPGTIALPPPEAGTGQRGPRQLAKSLHTKTVLEDLVHIHAEEEVDLMLYVGQDTLTLQPIDVRRKEPASSHSP